MARPKRILFVDHTAALSGGEIALLNLVSRLDRRRYTPIVVLGAEGPVAERLRAAGVQTHVLPLDRSVAEARKDRLGASALLRWGGLAAALAYTWRLARFIAARRVDLVHTNSLKADVIGGIAGRLAGKPVLWHVRDRIETDYLPAPVVRVFRAVCRIVPTAVVVNSAATMATLRLPPARRTRVRARVVHDGTELFAAPNPRHDDGGRPLVVGLVGRISRWKGQHVFLQATAVVAKNFPAARFRIIGAALFQERAYESELRDLTRSLGMTERVEFTGFRADVQRAIAELDVLVHASISGEPFGQVVIEAMAAAKPVVATDGGGIPEIVQQEVTGLLVPMGDAPAMAAAISRLLGDPQLRRVMGRRGWERVRDHFTLERTVGAIESLYADLLIATAARRRGWFGRGR